MELLPRPYLIEKYVDPDYDPYETGDIKDTDDEFVYWYTPEIKEIRETYRGNEEMTAVINGFLEK